MCPKFLAIFVALFAACSGKSIHFIDCGSGNINSVEVEPCQKEPCDFVEGQSYNVSGSFSSAIETSHPKLEVKVKALGFWVPYPGIETDPCQHYIECPITTGPTFFKIQVKAIGLFHNVNADVRIRIFTQNGNEIVCGVATVHAM